MFHFVQFEEISSGTDLQFLQDRDTYQSVSIVGFLPYRLCRTQQIIVVQLSNKVQQHPLPHHTKQKKFEQKLIT